MSIVSAPPVSSLEHYMAAAFDLGAPVLDVGPLGRGLINDTYLVTTAKNHAVLQRINQRAFPQPELIIQNLRVLIGHVATRAQHNGELLQVPNIFAARDGNDFALDPDGGFWRALTYFEESQTSYAIANVQQAEEVGAALGRFHTLVSSLESQRLHATRPNFHNTPEYFRRFTAVAAQSNAPQNAELKWCLAFAHERGGVVTVLEDAKRSGELKLRVIHGDPKLDNFLFDAQGAHIVSIIDLDTVQPGLVHFDIGDCLRSCANPVGESPKDVSDVHFDLEICRAILGRYLNETRNVLTAADIAHLYHAIRLIPLELGLRFLTDHLEGDVYFKTEHHGHNLHRAHAQFRLAADIEKKESAIRGLIAQMS